MYKYVHTKNSKNSKNSNNIRDTTIMVPFYINNTIYYTFQLLEFTILTNQKKIYLIII